MDFSGFCLEYHQNGKVKWIKEFNGRNAIGVWMCFDEKGILIKQINCKEKTDSLSQIYSGTFSNSFGKEDEIIKMEEFNFIVDYEPEADYPGGPDSLQTFIYQNFKYPQNAIDSGIVGRIDVSFVVEIDGKMSNISIFKEIETCPECNEEALRVFRLMPKWIPAIDNGKNIRSRMRVPINLTLN